MEDNTKLQKGTDGGFVVYDVDNALYYTGLGWDGQLRGSKVYHSRTYAERVMKSRPNRNCVLRTVSMETTD